ncbi:MAG: hypothetical protein A2096_06835, partial [Spirochaetes bacterium GWF1_41_5]
MKKHILGSLITTASYQACLSEIISLAEKRQNGYICVCNVHMLIESFFHKKFRNILNNATITLPDGMPVAKGISILHHIRQERIAGMDIFPDLLKKCALKNLSVFFYGNTETILNKIMTKSAEIYPSLKIAGAVSPPFRALTASENQHIINKINSSKPHLVFVSLGCPKQEIWMAEHQQIEALMIGVGAAFNVFSGSMNRAPLFLRNAGLEWLYRLFQEPRRLFCRYLKTNFIFIFLFFIELLYAILIPKQFNKQSQNTN